MTRVADGESGVPSVVMSEALLCKLFQRDALGNAEHVYWQILSPL